MAQILSFPRRHALAAALPDRQQSLFALCNLLAAALGLLVAFEASLPRPWFTLLTVYVTAQPMVGANRPKLMDRLGGLLLGAAVTVLLVPNLQNTPVLLVLLLACWSGLCVYLGVRERSPSAVFFQMAAFGATVISLPFIYDPAHIFETTIARVEEAAIGMFATVIVHQLLRPWDVERVLRRRASAFLGDACAWAGQALDADRTWLDNRRRQRLAADVAELGLMAFHLPTRRWPGHVHAGQVAALQQGLAELLPLVANVAEQVAVLRAAGRCPEDLAALIAATRAWISDPACQAPETLAARAEHLAQSPAPDWYAMVAASAAHGLAKLVEALARARDLAALSLDHPAGADAFTMPRDHSMAILSGLAMASAILLYCGLWIVLGWPNGATMAAFAAIMTGSFALQDDPAPAIARFLGDNLKTYPLAAFYMFFLLPRADGFPMLMLCIAPALLWMGYLQADPRHGPRALPIFSSFIVALNLQPSFANDFAVFANTASAQTAGIVTTLVVTRLFRSVEALGTARRLLRVNSQDLADLCDLHHPLRAARWSAHALDRLGQVAQRLAQTPQGEALGLADGLTDLQMGPQLIALRRSLPGLPHDPRRDLGMVLAQTGAYYRSRWAQHGAQPPAAALCERIDHALSCIAVLPASSARHAALGALVGLRCILFPDAGLPGRAP
ncbi:MAG: FUSC family protein [Sphingomonadales bacterium]|nr:FUSC family protein [Sphingomonadales bacterium]MDE2169768.1 FUSC family protein [Sphingomonadales bacterium]